MRSRTAGALALALSVGISCKGDKGQGAAEATDPRAVAAAHRK